MDFLSIKSELDSYKEYIENTNNTMTCILNFFINSKKSLSDYAQTTQSSLNELFKNLMKYDNRSAYIKKFFEFFRLFEKHLSNLINISKKIEKQLIKPTIDFIKFISNDNNAQLIELNKVFNVVSNQKKKYDQIKQNYFDSCKKAEKQEKVLLTEMEKKKSNVNSINNQNNILTKLRINSQNEYQKYKEEYKITDNLFDDCNKKYFPIINSLKDNEEKRINYLSFHLEKFISFIDEEKNSYITMLSSISNEDSNKKNNIFKSAKINDDMEIYSEKFNFIYKSEKRFINEKFLLYDIYRRNIESIISISNSIIRRDRNIEDFDPNSQFPGDYPKNAKPIFMEYNMSNNLRFESSNFSLGDNEQLIYNSLFSENPFNINKKLFTDFTKKLRNDTKFAENFVDKVLCEKFQIPIYYEFKSKDQFEKLSLILIEILKNNNENNIFYETDLNIIFIAEKGIFYDKILNKKSYLCKVISENNCHYLKEKKFWKKLLIYKINSTIKSLTDMALNEENQSGKNKQTKNLQKVTDTVKFIIDIGTGARNLSKVREQKEKSIKNKELLNIIKKFIIHLNNFNVDLVLVNDIIMEIGNEYNLPNEQISFLIS